MSSISSTCFCISFKMSSIKFYKFYKVYYVSRTESAPWVTPGPIPWPAGASLGQTVAAVSETTKPDKQCRSLSASQCLSGFDVSARLPSSGPGHHPLDDICVCFTFVARPRALALRTPAGAEAPRPPKKLAPCNGAGGRRIALDQ